MVWDSNNSQGYESRKCRHRVTSFLAGQGLDLGCGMEKVCDTAIGIDYRGPAADITLDLSELDSLRLFQDDAFDYVFSSHLLEHMIDTEGTLREWWRVIRYGGHLILYVPDPDYYPKCGTDGANPAHVHDLTWQDAWKVIEGFGNAKLVSATRHNEANEYSWLLVVQKRFSLLRRPYEWAEERVHHWCRSLAGRVRKAPNECLVIRYGAFGDAVWMTAPLRQLKKDGWYIIYNTSEYSAQVLRDCPYIDEFLLTPKNAIPHDQLPAYWEAMGRHFDRVINFSGSIETGLLKPEGTPEYDLSHAERHRLCNVNYMDRTMEVAGYPHLKGQLPELHFAENEEVLMRHLLKIHLQDRFLLVWSLAGSSFHKHTLWTPYVCGDLWKNYGKEVVIVTVGDKDCQIIEPHGMPNVVRKSGVLSIRAAMLLTKYAHLVVGPETGILNAASCFETPKVIFLSHSSEENLTKYWKNVTVLHPQNCPCHPCHRLIYSNCCPKGPLDAAPLCVENILPQTMYDAIDAWIQKWRNKEAPYGSIVPVGGDGKLPRKLRRRHQRVKGVSR